MRTLEEIAKDPRLDDEGTYDYLAEDLPEDKCGWTRGRYCKCDSCGKYRYWTRTAYHYFYCWDGWDYMSDSSCWVCELKQSRLSPAWHIRKLKYQLRKHQDYRKLYKAGVQSGIKRAKAKKIAKDLTYGRTR